MRKVPLAPWGGYAGIPESDPDKFEIRVADKIYPMSSWRQAILAYLFGIWSGDRKFLRDPEIRFGSARLILPTGDCRRDRSTDVFRLGGTGPEEPFTTYYGNYSLSVNVSRTEVMEALARFAKDPFLGRIHIDAGDTMLVLSQKERRGEYGCYFVKSDGQFGHPE